MEKYHELFEEHLEARLRLGGDPGHMVSIAKIYENDGHGDMRRYAFQEWVHGEEFGCSRCRTRFRVTGSIPGEWDETLCERCEKCKSNT
jgi:hypothetical protein